MVLFAILLFVQSTASQNAELALNADNTSAFIEVLTDFRSLAAEGSQPPSSAAAKSSLTSVLAAIEKSGKQAEAAVLAKKSGFTTLQDWASYGDLLFAAIQQSQIAQLSVEARNALQQAKDSERQGLTEHVAVLDKAAASVEMSRNLTAAEREYVAKNATSISKAVGSLPEKPKN
jgi:hypothetical protein